MTVGWKHSGRKNETKTQTERTTDAIGGCFKLSAAEVITPTHTHTEADESCLPAFLRGPSSALWRLTVTLNGPEEFTRNLSSSLSLSIRL